MSPDFTQLLLLYAVMQGQVEFKTTASDEDSQITSMRFSRVSNFPPNAKFFYLMSTRSKSRIQCFSLCLKKQAQCIALIYHKTQRLCRLITTEVTEERVSADVLKSGMVALKMTHVCERGYHFYNRHCYRFGEFKMTWRKFYFVSMQDECELMGAYLTEVETVDENTWLTTTFLQPIVNTVECPEEWTFACSSWIGAERLNASEFIWNRRGNIVTYSPWYPGEPDNQKCVHLLRSALWDDDYCDTPRHFICEKDFHEL